MSTRTSGDFKVKELNSEQPAGTRIIRLPVDRDYGIIFCN